MEDRCRHHHRQSDGSAPKNVAAGPLVDVSPSYETTATELESSLWLAYLSRSHLALRLRVFLDFLKEVFRDGPPWERKLADANAQRRGARQA